MEMTSTLIVTLMSLISLFSLVFLLIVFYIAIQHRRYAHIPQPPGSTFFFGHLPIIKICIKRGEFIFDIFTRWHEEVGPVYLIWKLTMPMIYTNQPDDIQMLAGTNISKAFMPIRYIWGIRVVPNSFFVMEKYSEWKPRRTTYNPAFSRNYLLRLVPKIRQVVQENLIDQISLKADGQTLVDMRPYFAAYSMQVLTQVAFTIDLYEQSFFQKVLGKETFLDVLHTATEALEFMIRYRMLGLLIRPDLREKYTTTASKFRIIGHHCIKQRIKALEANQTVPEDVLTKILSVARQDNSIQLDDLVDDFITFFVAGQETVASLLSFTIFLLAQHPDSMNRVVNEIDEVLGDRDDIDANDLENLTYTQQVLEESLRLYPPAPYFGKQAPKDCRVSGYKVPEGSLFVASPYVMHHLPQNFTDPEAFDPDRFDPSHKKPSPYVYFPFGFGHRVCIGKPFAMMEAKVTLAQLLRRFTFSMTPGQKPRPRVAMTMQPKQVPCFIRRRPRVTL